MADSMRQSSPWHPVLDLAATQHGVVTRRQLLELGLSSRAVTHLLRRRLLHRTHTGVYAVGRPRLDVDGERTAALLACGAGSWISHSGAIAFWRLGPRETPLEISVSPPRTVARPGIIVHRRSNIAAIEIRVERGIAVSDPVRTLIDIAPRKDLDELENLLGAADRRDLLKPELVVRRLEPLGPDPGVSRLRLVVERRTLTLTDSHLERLLLPIARRAGLGDPLTQEWVNGYRVDFYWPDLGLVVETDGLKYHRTPAQQTVDKRRDQAHTAAGLTPLRFSHAQVAYTPADVEEILRQTARRLSSRLSSD